MEKSTPKAANVTVLGLIVPRIGNAGVVERKQKGGCSMITSER